MRMYFTMSKPKPVAATKAKPVPQNQYNVPRSSPNRFGLKNTHITKKTSCACGK